MSKPRGHLPAPAPAPAPQRVDAMVLLPSLASMSLTPKVADTGPRFKSTPTRRDVLTALMLPPPASTPHEPCPDHACLEARVSTIPGAGNGLFTTQTIPANCLLAEYWGPVATDEDVTRHGASMYAASLPTPAVPLSCCDDDDSELDVVVGNPSTCVLANANTVTDELRESSNNVYGNNCLLVSASDQRIQNSGISREYLQPRHCARLLFGGPVPTPGDKKYACERLYAWSGPIPIPANTEIFLNYGSQYKDWKPT